MSFAKVTKLWAVYTKTSTCQAFIRGCHEIDADLDPVVIRTVWHAFEVASEKTRKRRSERVRLDEPQCKAAVGGRR
jgi:hypothetical protein